MDDKMVQVICEHCGCVIVEVTQDKFEELTNIDDNGIEHIGNAVKLYVYDHEFYCSECGEERFEECCECGELIDKDNDGYAYDTNGNIYCEDCRDDYLEWCEHCEQYTRSSTFRVFTTSTGSCEEDWCEDCVNRDSVTCGHCGDFFSADVRMFEVNDGDEVCEGCFDTHYYQCDECGYYVDSDHRYYDDDDNTLCWDCYQVSNSDIIHGYHDYPSNWKFRNEPNNGEDEDYFRTLSVRKRQLHIGPELEIDEGGRNSQKAIEITTALGFPANESDEFKCSRDGSLNNGFEIIAMPATYDWHMKHYNWEAGLKKAKELGYNSHDSGTCGLHFHVDRAYFTDSMVNPEEGFCIVATNNINWFKAFSRRNNYHYCEFQMASGFEVDSFKGDKAERTQEQLDALRRAYRGHNAALNFVNASTIELRFVRGTLKYSTFKAAFQFVELLCYAVKHFRKEQLVNVNLQWFKRFAEKRGYTEFLNYLQERGIMS